MPDDDSDKQGAGGRTRDQVAESQGDSTEYWGAPPPPPPATTTGDVQE